MEVEIPFNPNDPESAIRIAGQLVDHINALCERVAKLEREATKLAVFTGVAITAGERYAKDSTVFRDLLVNAIDNGVEPWMRDSPALQALREGMLASNFTPPDGGTRLRIVKAA